MPVACDRSAPVEFRMDGSLRCGYFAKISRSFCGIVHPAPLTPLNETSRRPEPWRGKRGRQFSQRSTSALHLVQGLYTIRSLDFSMKHTSHYYGSTIRRCGSAFWAAAFLFFLLYSAPHQVHHVFEQPPQAHHHGANHDHSTGDRHDRSSTDSNCVFQISASRCYLGLVANFLPAVLPMLIGLFTDIHPSDSGSTYLAAAFHIRAPPLA